MASENETVEDLVKELRGIKGGQHTNGGLSFERWRARCQFADDYADRFEAAHRREVGELCGERNGILNANASLAADNDRLRREVAELKSKMNDVVCENEALRDACGTCGAKREREATREKPSQVGNSAKLREACEAIMSEIGGYLTDGLEVIWCRISGKTIKKSRAALSAPPRNCDRPECATTKAAQDVWRKEDGGKTAYYEWLLAASTKGGAE